MRFGRKVRASDSRSLEAPLERTGSYAGRATHPHLLMDLLSSEPSPAPDSLTPSSTLVGLLAACAGALVWAAVSYFTGYEVGYVAWAIGGLVGLATVKFGGRGVACAGVAAVLTVAGIAGGKLLGTRFVVEKELQDAWEASFTPALHAELVVDAADFAQLGDDVGDEELRSFMVEHRYTAAESPEGVQEEELQAFLSSNAPDLRALHETPLSYEDWYAETTAESRQAFEEGFSIVQANVEELNAIDLLFVFLGVTTAFGIVRRASPDGTGPVATTDNEDVRKAA